MRRRLVASVVAWGLAAAAAGAGCTGADGDAACARTVAIDLAADPGMAPMLGDLADSFNGSAAARPAEGDGACARVVVHPLAASRAAALLDEGWRQAPADLPEPVIWAPGASTWATLLDQRRAAAGDRAIAYDVTPVARTPLVVALPRDRAEALGWPERPIRLAELLRLAAADLASGCGVDDAPGGMRLLVERWCAEDWGPFRLGKADPDLAASGLAALVVQAYAATGKVEGLEVEDLDDLPVVRFTAAVEATVARYGESSRRLLDTLRRTGATATAPASDVTAVLVEEQAVVDANRADPTDAEPLAAVYPAEGTIELDGPLVVLDAAWSGADERAGARRFVAYVRSSDVQRRVLDYGFRPVEPTVEVEGPLFEPDRYGVDPDPVVPTLPMPDAAVLDALLDRGRDQRRPARVLLVVDVSRSMGDPSDIHHLESPTKLDLAKRALTDVLDRFGDRDEVGLWVFSTALSGPGTAPGGQVRERVPPRRMDADRGRQRRSLANAIGALRPRNDTALYAATAEAHAAVVRDHDPDRIDAVVLLTDGHDEAGGTAASSEAARRALLDDLAAPERRDQPVPVFTVAYGGDADVEVLRQVADAANGAFYDATDPATLGLALTEAVANV